MITIMLVMYGDHYGISENHNKAMAQIIGKEITPFENANLQRVPLIIHVPGMEGGVNHTYGGQMTFFQPCCIYLGLTLKIIFNLVPTYYQKSIMK